MNEVSLICLVCDYKDLNQMSCTYQQSTESVEEASCTPKHPLLRAWLWLHLGPVPTHPLSTCLTSQLSMISAGWERTGCCIWSKRFSSYLAIPLKNKFISLLGGIIPSHCLVFAADCLWGSWASNISSSLCLSFYTWGQWKRKWLFHEQSALHHFIIPLASSFLSSSLGYFENQWDNGL